MTEPNLSFPQRSTETVLHPNPTTEATQRAAGPNFFRDGENVQFMWAESIVTHTLSNNILRLEVRTKHQTNRTAQTHDSVMHQFITEDGSYGQMCFEISFFTEEIFRVKFAGQEKILRDLTDEPEFPPPEARMLVGRAKDVKIEITVDEGEILISSSAVQIKAERNPFRLSAVRIGERIPFWKQRLSDLFTADVIPTSLAAHEGREAVFEAFTLDPSEAVFGLGERFDGVARKGRPVDFVNHDAIGTSNMRSYINVPFFWSTKGYGCFVNQIARTEFDIGMTEQGTVGFGTEEPFMDYFIVSGITPKDILMKYTSQLTGTPALPPLWTFGLWLSRNSYPSWTVVDEVMAKADSLGIPYDDIHLDTSWFKEDWNPDLLFSEERFPHPEKKMAALKEKGVRISLWQYTFIQPRDDNILYLEGCIQNDYIGREVLPSGSRGPKPFAYPEGTTGWKTDDLVIDYSNPAAVSWYSAKISKLIEQGAGAIKTDFGDCIPPDAHYLNIPGRKFQNLYSLAYNAAIRKATSKVDVNTGQWARAGTAGSQRYPVHWGGDSQCSWSALQGSLKATLSIGLSGFAFFSHDIGGFIGKPTRELYIRWAQLGLLASHSRTHGAGDENGREPWFFGDQAVEIFKKFALLRYRLLPYIIQQSRIGAEVGVPLVRALILEYPQDRNVWGIETQYLFGSDLLIAPILQPADEAAKHDVYLPKGIWYDFWTHEKTVSRGEWIVLEDVALDVVPMWVKEGAIICWTKERTRTWDEAGEVVLVQCFGDKQSWSTGDGMGGVVEVVMGSKGKLLCKGREGVAIESFK